MATRADMSGDEELTPANKLALTGRFIKTYWKIIFALIWATMLIPLFVVNNTSETRCGYVILVMAGYWISDCFPMAVTSLIPVVLFPAFGILSTADTCACYMNDTIMVFIGGLILAVATEHSNLHLRIALGVMKTVGCTHARLLGGVCAVTTFISMWVSNTAATAMMVPIIFAILGELEQAGLSRVFEASEPDPERPESEPEQKPTKVTKAYLMASAYCSTFGGTGTIVGTGTNLTFKGIYENTFPDAPPINFTQWMLASIPQMAVNSFFTWIHLRVTFLGFLRPRSKDAQQASIGEEGQAITNRVTNDSTNGIRKDLRDSVPVICASILMFFIPRELSFLRSFSRDAAARPEKSSEGLITWEVIQRKMPWSLMFLLGGGFAISKGSVASGLARKVGEFLMPLRHLPPMLILFFVSVFTETITEFTSNVGIANITLPVIAQMCVAMEMHPLYLMYPAAIMCSYSFRLPVGTPPNAIITVVGRIPTKWLMFGGCAPAVYSVVVQMIFFVTWGVFIWEIDEFPDWAKHPETSN
ncbi:unnamed protein product [Xylocopa violacea]|uniref:Citrate transporter-like domain-containing protein n=1 Tax=Xylocopa violacea TaxID=135666 RepID=A0ABP1NNY4_XYLVO